MYARLRCGGNLPLCLAFGTGEVHLRYGICVPCSKRLPGVRDASSGAFGAQKGFLGYATHLQRPAEQPTPQTVDSLLGYAAHFQRRAVPKAAPAAPDASSVRETAPLSLFAPATPSPAPSTALGTRNDPRSEVSRHKKKRPKSKTLISFVGVL